MWGGSTVTQVTAPPDESGEGNGAHIPLPSGLSDPRRTAGAVFDGIATLYDRARPGYPPAALADLVRRCRIDEATRILEVGCGTGQLTRQLAPTGAAIHCVEPGPALARLARRNLAGRPNVEITTVAFEDLEARPGSYDVVVSATAFHWVDPTVSFAKAAELLHPGGCLALLTNAHGDGGSHTTASIAGPVAELHRQLAPEVGEWTFPTSEEIRHKAEAGGDVAAVWARLERKLSEYPDVSDLFEPPTVATYPWLATYDRDAYLDVLASQSSYALMDPGRRAELLQGIGRLVDEQLGGVVTKEYVTVLTVARTWPTPRGAGDRPADEDRAGGAPEIRFGKDLYRGTAPFYARYRPPYPEALLDDLCRRLPVTGAGRLLDLSCGTGQIALPLARHFAEVVALDQEPAALAYGQAEAEARGLTNITWMTGDAEDVDFDADFELVAVGNAFHRLDRPLVAQHMLSWLQPAGGVALLWGGVPSEGDRPWQTAMVELLQDWTARGGAADRIPTGWLAAIERDPHEQVLGRAGFDYAGRFEFTVESTWTVRSLIGFMYSTSILNQEVLGDQRVAFEEDLAGRLLALQPDGAFPASASFAYQLARKPL